MFPDPLHIAIQLLSLEGTNRQRPDAGQVLTVQRPIEHRKEISPAGAARMGAKVSRPQSRSLDQVRH